MTILCLIFNEAFLYSWMRISLCHFLPGHKDNALPQSIYLSLFQAASWFLMFMFTREVVFTDGPEHSIRISRQGWRKRLSNHQAPFNWWFCKKEMPISILNYQGPIFSLVHVSEGKVWLNVQKSERIFASLSWWVVVATFRDMSVTLVNSVMGKVEYFQSLPYKISFLSILWSSRQSR